MRPGDIRLTRESAINVAYGRIKAEKGTLVAAAAKVSGELGRHVDELMEMGFFLGADRDNPTAEGFLAAGAIVEDR